MERLRQRAQPTATVLACFCGFRDSSICRRLPPFATTGLHKGSIRGPALEVAPPQLKAHFRLIAAMNLVPLHRAMWLVIHAASQSPEPFVHNWRDAYHSSLHRSRGF
jgi:hypothetical protein